MLFVYLTHVVTFGAIPVTKSSCTPASAVWYRLLIGVGFAEVWRLRGNSATLAAERAGLIGMLGLKPPVLYLLPSDELTLKAKS